MREKTRFLTTLILMTAVALLTACGGSSGGDGGGASIPYSGVTTQAAIDDTNAGDLAAAAYTGSELGQIAGFSAVQGSSSEQTANLPVVQSLTELMMSAPEMANSAPVASNARYTSGPEPLDSCRSGSATATINYNEATGDLSYSITNNSCDNGEVVMDGVLSFTVAGAQFDGAGEPNLEGLTLSFNYQMLTLTWPDGQSVTTSGTATMVQSGFIVTMTMDIVEQDNATGQTAMLENYQVRVTEGIYPAPDQIEILEGSKFYHSDYGFVSISTPVPLEIDPLTDEPVAGVVLINGADGSYAEVTFSPDGSSGTWYDGATDGSFSI